MLAISIYKSIFLLSSKKHLRSNCGPTSIRNSKMLNIETGVKILQTFSAFTSKNKRTVAYIFVHVDNSTKLRLNVENSKSHIRKFGET